MWNLETLIKPILTLSFFNFKSVLYMSSDNIDFIELDF